MTKTTRSEVLVLGAAPIAEEPFVERRLQLSHANVTELTTTRLSSARAILICDYPGKFGLLNEYLGGPFKLAASLGLRTAVQVGDADADRAAFLRNESFDHWRVKDDPLLPWVLIGRDAVGVAETIARYDPGPPWGKVDVLPDRGTVLDEATTMLLQRAFHDCSEIVIEPLRGGKTAKRTFRVYAKLRDPGSEPMPFFFKQGTPQDIGQERFTYVERAEPFIPFHLRPALNDARCVTTLTEAGLVSNFVEGGMPLRDALRRGHGRGTIFSLFEVTLRGIRSHASQSPKSAGDLKAFIHERVKAEKIAENHPARIERARKYRLKMDPVHLEAQLKTASEDENIRRGHYHGDMHAGNVLVRGDDAIVIDFGSMAAGPLTADPAILEVSLAFGTDESDRPNDFGEWRALIDDLFRKQSALLPPIVRSEHGPFAWLRRALREVRHVVNSCGATPRERLLVLAACLIRFARLSPDDLSPRLLRLSENRRSYALVIAEDIYTHLP